MRNVLIDNPEPIVVHGEDERIPDLPERLKSGKYRRIVRRCFFIDGSCAVIFLLILGYVAAEGLWTKPRYRYCRIRLNRESILESE